MSGLTKGRFDLVQSYEQISSGRKVLKASDDPVVSARILDMQRNLANIEQSERHAVTALNDLSNEEAVLTQVQSLILRSRSLMLQGANGTQGTENKTMIASELNQILEQVVDLANSLNSDGAYVFSGYKADEAAYSFTRDANDNIVSVVYEGDSNSIEKTVSPTLKVKTSHPGTEVFGNAPDDLFAQLIQARDDLNSDIEPSNIPELDDIYTLVTGGITDIGNRTNQVESAQDVNESVYLNQTAALGRIRDLDLPSAIAEFTQLEVNMQAINNTFAKVATTSLFDYL